MPQLAALGGPRTVEGSLEAPWPISGELEEQLLLEVLHSGRWNRASGNELAASKVGQFEDAFAKFQDAQYALGVTNGTAAIECALKAVEVEPGDEVIVPAASFVATASAAVQVGGVPIFVDVDPRNYTIDPRAVEAAITPRTRAIIGVDLGGMACDTDALNAIGRQHGIAIVSDCAHSHGSRWKGVGVGALGDVGAFSFQILKTLPLGEGGMVLTNRRDVVERAYSYHSHGRVRGRPHDEHHAPATNLRMSEWQGAVGLGQLSRLEEQTRHREANAAYLMRGLKEIDGVAPIYRDPRVTRWGFFFLLFKFLPEQWDGVTLRQFRRAMAAEGIRIGSGHTQPLYQNAVFAEMNFGRTGHPIRCPLYTGEVDYTQVRCPELERIFTTEACSLTHRCFLGPREDMDRVLDAIRKLRAHQDELRTIDASTLVDA